MILLGHSQTLSQKPGALILAPLVIVLLRIHAALLAQITREGKSTDGIATLRHADRAL